MLHQDPTQVSHLHAPAYRPLPKLAVADTKYTKGAQTLKDGAPPMHALPLDEAFGAAWSTDAHFVTYCIVGGSQEAMPRLTKPILPRLRHLGADIHLHTFAFDYDTPGHVPWTEELYRSFWQKMSNAAARWEIAGRWSLLYTTRAGARLVYVLTESVPVDTAEAKHRWMVKQFEAVGLEIDHLSDWTRLFRMPYVTREGKQTWLDPMYFDARYHNRLSPDELGEAEKGEVTDYAEIRHFDEPKPDNEDAQALFEEYNRETGRKRQSWWYTEAKKRLRGRECYPCIFEHKPLAEKGARDQTLHKYVGQAISMLFRLEGTTPTHVYALFIDPVMQLEPDTQTPDWTNSLWSHIGRLWVREEAKFNAESEKAAKVEESNVATLEAVIEGMRQWCDHPALKQDMKTASEFALQHMVACTANNYFVIRRDGWFDEMQLSRNQLIPRIRALGMDKLIETQTVKEDGTGFRDVSAESIINKHATVIPFLRGVPNKSGGYVENMDLASAVLVLPCFERNPHLTPTFNPDVDEWLQEFFGPQHYIPGCEWIALALAFDEGPICAASLAGAAGAGKKMFVRGLAETLRVPKVATADDLVGSTQYNLLMSPFLHVDEGWPQGQSRGRHPADQFRALVSGQSFDCNRKWMMPIEVNNPARVILTANNLSLVQMLTMSRDLSPEERQSLGIRIKHFVIPERAMLWLKMRGGVAFTGKKGARWIAGDSNEPSDFILAKHFLWLHSQRQHIRRGLRFLVDGDMSPELMFEMRTNSGSAPAVIETIIKLLNSMQPKPGLVIQDHRMFVLTQEILEFHRGHRTSGMKDLSANTITAVLKNLIIMEHPNPMVLRERATLSKRRWYELDPVLLLQYARRDGWSCPKLEQLVSDREAMGLIMGP